MERHRQSPKPLTEAGISTLSMGAERYETTVVPGTVLCCPLEVVFDFVDLGKRSAGESRINKRASGGRQYAQLGFCVSSHNTSGSIGRDVFTSGFNKYLIEVKFALHKHRSEYRRTSVE